MQGKQDNQRVCTIEYPHTTGCTLDSSWSTSRAYHAINLRTEGDTGAGRGARRCLAHTFSQSLCTSLSASCLQLMRLSIQPSSVGIVVGSVVRTDDSCIGSGILTSSMLVSMTAGQQRAG